MTPVFRFLSPISLPRKHFVHLGSSFFLSSLLFLPLISPDPYEDMDLLLYSTTYRFLQFLLLDNKNVFVAESNCRFCLFISLVCGPKSEYPDSHPPLSRPRLHCSLAFSSRVSWHS